MKEAYAKAIDHSDDCISLHYISHTSYDCEDSRKIDVAIMATKEVAQKIGGGK